MFRGGGVNLGQLTPVKKFKNGGLRPGANGIPEDYLAPDFGYPFVFDGQQVPMDASLAREMRLFPERFFIKEGMSTEGPNVQLQEEERDEVEIVGEKVKKAMKKAMKGDDVADAMNEVADVIKKKDKVNKKDILSAFKSLAV